MEDPGHLIEEGMQETAQILALKASVKEGKRLLREAIRQRDLARSETERQVRCRTSELNALWAVQRQWPFFLFSKELKEKIVRLAPFGKISD